MKIMACKIALGALICLVLIAASSLCAGLTKMLGGSEVLQGIVFATVVWKLPDVLEWLVSHAFGAEPL